MTVELDHVIVPSHTRDASGRRLAELLGVPCGPASAGPFFAVYVNAGLTLDFIQTEEAFAIAHFCFRVGDDEFAQILGRIQSARIPYRSAVGGPFDMKINTEYGGSMIYWNEPDDLRSAMKRAHSPWPTVENVHEPILVTWRRRIRIGNSTT